MIELHQLQVITTKSVIPLSKKHIYILLHVVGHASLLFFTGNEALLTWACNFQINEKYNFLESLLFRS